MEAKDDSTAHTLRPHDRRALRSAGVVPMTFADARCWGHRSAPICTDCSRLQAPADYTGDFPVMRLLVPRAYLRHELTGPPIWFCVDRRSAGTHIPDASVSSGAGLVGTAGHHVETVPACGETRNPAQLGGLS